MTGLLTHIQNIDTFLTFLIYSSLPHEYMFTLIFSFFSLYGNSILIWTLLIIFALFLEERKNPGIQKRDITFIAFFFLSFLTTSILVNFILKNIVQRPRPISFDVVRTDAFSLCPNSFSFPSGHASAAFAAATVLAAFDKKRKWYYYSVAVLISLSRVYLGCHYFFDILSGALIGWFISFVILKFKYLSFRL